MNIEGIENLDTAIGEAKLLIAEPFMLDPHFRRAVVMLCEHDINDGTIGFILNKPLGMQLNDLLASFPSFDAPVFYGGPVSTDTIHYVHNLGETLSGSIKIAQGLYWGGDFDELKRLVNAQVVQPKHIRFFIGYSGWSAGQLCEELRGSSWLLGHIDANYVFKATPDDTLWTKVLDDEGDTFSVIGQIPEPISWN